MGASMNPAIANALATKLRLDSDFGFFAATHLFYKHKVTLETTPFLMNTAQAMIHAECERQLAERGYVRIILPKSRQQGASTYSTARGYWKATRNRNTTVAVMAHLDDATHNLFAMVRQYHTLCPKWGRPNASSNAANSLDFGSLNSGYKLATARSKGTGRSANVQFFHGSEVAFWPSLKDNLAGIGQAVLSQGPGTEIILESTGNGRNEYYTLALNSIKGLTDYRVCFLPWYISPEYKAKPSATLDLSDEDWAYAETYGLSIEQMAWRSAKIFSDFDGDVTLFDQEYPASFSRAFARSPTGNPFIRPVVTEAAKRRGVVLGNMKPKGPIRMGVDPSAGSHSGDRFMLVTRDDLRVRQKIQLKLTTDDTMEAIGAILGAIEAMHPDERPDAIFVDRIGVGAGVCDTLGTVARSKNHRFRVIGVKGSEKASNSDRYFNKRSEMWGEMREWLTQGGALIADDELEADLTLPAFKYHGEQYQLEPKDRLVKRTGVSPDCGDALADTFYLPFAVLSTLGPDALRSGGSNSAGSTDSWKVL